MKVFKEKWRWVVGFRHFYKISNFGRVKGVTRIVGGKNGTTRTKHEALLKVTLDGNGYPFVGLCKNGKVIYRRVHRLVLESFVGPCPNNKEGCHKNDDKLNNHLSNLYWGTDKQNTRDAIRNGTRNKPMIGELNGNTTLTSKDVERIRNRYARGDISMKSLAAKYHVSAQTVCNIVHHRCWKVSA